MWSLAQQLSCKTHASAHPDASGLHLIAWGSCCSVSQEVAKGLMQLWLFHLLLLSLLPVLGHPTATRSGIRMLPCNLAGKGRGKVSWWGQVPTGSQDLCVRKVVTRKHSDQFLCQYLHEGKLREQCPSDSKKNPNSPPKP